MTMPPASLIPAADKHAVGALVAAYLARDKRAIGRLLEPYTASADGMAHLLLALVDAQAALVMEEGESPEETAAAIRAHLVTVHGMTPAQTRGE